MSRDITIYEPDNSLKKGYLNIFSEIFNELRKNTWLTYQLFKRDFLAMYKQSFIGVLWALIIPLVSVATFILLNKSGLLNFGDIGVPYMIYALIGMMFWQLFSIGIIASSNSLVNAGPMIIRINFSKKSLVIASVAQSIVAFLIQLILVGILFVAYGFVPTTGIYLLPLLIIPLLFLTLGFGFILSILNGVIRDVGNAISLIIAFLLFLTPVLYSKPATGILAKATSYNILYYLISGPRELILTGVIPELKGFLISCIISIILFVVCLVVFHLTETRITERV